jgi:2-haloacid dehalogenase
MKKAYSWLLFDADGTLFDFDSAEAQALQLTLSQAGDHLEPAELASYRQAFKRINGDLWRLFEDGGISQDTLKVARFAKLVDETGITADPVAMSTMYLANLAKNSDLLPGAESLLETLAGEYQMAIITNGLKAVQRPRFGRATITHHFAAIIISDEVGVAKPDPRIFDAAFDEMDQPQREEVLIIGDSLTSDIAGGINYGIDTCWYNPHGRPRPADMVIQYELQNLHQLTQILSVE